MHKYSRPESPDTLSQRYEDQARIQRALIYALRTLREITEKLQSAFPPLLADENFTTLLRAENLNRVPAALLNRSMRTTAKHGQCIPDATEMLRSKVLSPTALYELRRMVPARQEEFARLMIASGCFISPYVRSLVGASDRSSFANGKGRPRKLVMKHPERNAANKEIGELAGQLEELSAFGRSDVIALFISIRYTERLLNNRHIKRYLKRHWSEVGQELEKTVRLYREAEPILAAPLHNNAETGGTMGDRSPGLQKKSQR